MTDQRDKAAADKTKGTVKEVAGKLTGDRDLEAEGKVDQAKGDLRHAASDVKNAVKNVTRK